MEVTEEMIENDIVTCIWCGQERIPIKQKSNARGYGFYGCCPKCGKETVVEEVEESRG